MRRKTTREDYARRIERAAAHIAEHLDEPLDLDRLADVACFSRWHFHRIYRGVMGETAEQTVRRRRLFRATLELIETDKPIATIAARAGYGSAEAFSRSFAAAFGRPPSAYRAERAPITAMSKQTPITKEFAQMYDVQLEIAPPRALIGFAHRGPYTEIGGVFERLSAWAGPRGLIGPTTAFIAVSYDDPEAIAAAALRSFAGMTAPNGATPELTAHLEAEGAPTRLTLDGGPVATFVHKGPYAELPAAFRWLFSAWLPESGREPADAPCYEIYLNDPRHTPAPELLTAIYLPLAGD